jgi:hypothetical protein
LSLEFSSTCVECDVTVWKPVSALCVCVSPNVAHRSVLASSGQSAKDCDILITSLEQGSLCLQFQELAMSVGFMLLMAVTVKNTILWVVTLYSMVEVS